MTFDGTNVNTNDALNTTTGIFTAPTTGAYYFSFTALKNVNQNNLQTVGLFANQKRVATMWVGVLGAAANIPTTLNAIVRLNAGETAYVQNVNDGIWGSGEGRATHFVGFLIGQ